MPQLLWVHGQAAIVPYLLGILGLFSCAGTDNTLWQPSRRAAGLSAMQEHRTSGLFLSMMACAGS